MSKDASIIQDVRAHGDLLLSFAEDKAFVARRIADHFIALADLEEKLVVSRRKYERAKTPSGTFAGVGEAFSRAKTEAKNPEALLAEARAADEEHRDTPVAPLPIETVARHPKDDR